MLSFGLKPWDDEDAAEALQIVKTFAQDDDK